MDTDATTDLKWSAPYVSGAAWKAFAGTVSGTEWIESSLSWWPIEIDHDIDRRTWAKRLMRMVINRYGIPKNIRPAHMVRLRGSTMLVRQGGR